MVTHFHVPSPGEHLLNKPKSFPVLSQSNMQGLGRKKDKEKGNGLLCAR